MSVAGGLDAMAASDAVALFGSTEPRPVRRTLATGCLSATLEAGQLRWIRIDGVEAIRGISFLVRDRNWGTVPAAISDLSVSEHASGFEVTYTSRWQADSGVLHASARINGTADGSLTFQMNGVSDGDVVTNRAGFVVLHPLDNVVGAPVTIERPDGSIDESRFPTAIDPACPFTDIRALSHALPSGARVTCRMEGDAFEMEDHRNWLDASFKTYVRPLARPWPFTIGNGEEVNQRVSVSLSGATPPAAPSAAPSAAPHAAPPAAPSAAPHAAPPAAPSAAPHAAPPASPQGAGSVTVTFAEVTGGRAPRLGLAVPAEYASHALGKAELLRAAGPSFLVCHFDPRAGHDYNTIRAFSALGQAVGAPLVLEAVVACTDRRGRFSADPSLLRRDAGRVGDMARTARWERVALSPAADLKSTPPGSRYPSAPSWADLAGAARNSFPGLPIGGGMFSHFTELNRKRPPRGLFDFVFHCGAPIVHACDDESVMETLDALPHVFSSVRGFMRDTPYFVFPTAISMRMNPYGEAPLDNPHNVRQPMSVADPRERGLLGAAWYAGYFARAARAGVDALTLGAVAGPSGIVSPEPANTLPFFRETDAVVSPSWHAFAACAAIAGAPLRPVETSAPAVEGVCAETPAGFRAVLTNLTDQAQTVSLVGVPPCLVAHVLDGARFAQACRDPLGLPAAPLDTRFLHLDPYALAILTGPRV